MALVNLLQWESQISKEIEVLKYSYQLLRSEMLCTHRLPLGTILNLTDLKETQLQTDSGCFQNCNCIFSDDFYSSPTMHQLLNTKPIALKNLFTISATVASAEGSTSHLKLIKTYLRLTKSREHLSDLAKISIKCDVAVLLDYIDLINELVAVSTRKVWL